jgi:hypothetical protein
MVVVCSPLVCGFDHKPYNLAMQATHRSEVTEADIMTRLRVAGVAVLKYGAHPPYCLVVGKQDQQSNDLYVRDV